MDFGSIFKFILPIFQLALQALPLILPRPGAGQQAAPTFDPRMFQSSQAPTEPTPTVLTPPPHGLTQQQRIAQRASIQQRGLSGASPEFMAEMYELPPEEYLSMLSTSPGSFYG